MGQMFEEFTCDAESLGTQSLENGDILNMEQIKMVLQNIPNADLQPAAPYGSSIMQRGKVTVKLEVYEGKRSECFLCFYRIKSVLGY